MSVTKIGVAGLGVGKAFFNVVKQRQGVEVSAICDINETRLREVKMQQNIQNTYSSLDAMLKSDIDVVILATPIQIHGAQALAAMRAGKHVLCQYIAATDVVEAKALIEASETNRRKYMFIETDCYERKNMVMMSLAKQGVFGELTMGRGHYMHNCQTMGRNPDGSLTWRGKLWMESPGGGFSAIHNAMPLLEAFGERRVIEVYSYGPGARTLPEYCLHDRVTTVGKLPSGRILEFIEDILSWQRGRSGYCIQGTKGCFDFDRAALVKDGKLSDWNNIETLEKEFGLEHIIRDSGGHQSSWGACLDAFLQAIQQDTRPPQDLFDALHITAIGWAANESLRSGLPARVVQFD